MSVGSNVEEEEHAITRKLEKLRPLNCSADVGVVERPGHMSGPRQLGCTKKNAPFLCKVNMAKLGSARSAVDESFSGGSVNLESNWRRKEFVFPDVVAWQGEDGHAMARRPGSPKYTAREAE